MVVLNFLVFVLEIFTFISTVALLSYRLLLLLFCFFIIAINYSKIGCTKLFCLTTKRLLLL